ncbi:MAG: alanine--tRNA ligase [Planctomycetaceae bacterium]|nr:alanine--tRNA ligase [Planctomycetaceae bacterium]
MQTNELREKYLEFFESKGCVRKPSDVLVPKWDPSVLFTPAGMNQFKDHFLGRIKLEFTRATTCQKCLRTGDIDNVGRTAYHHTFFEMLGNFSFGDYFKREAIHWAWEFLTSKQWLAIEPGKLSVTVYKDDHEAAKIWLEEIGVPAARLQYLDEDENFWPASAPTLGPDGVCGPCSEIYHNTPNGPVEIWNLVFTQFNRVGEPAPNGEHSNLQPLPSQNIDTGMGLERCAAVLQGVETNYHIDILRPLVEAAAEVLSVKYDPASDNGRRLRRIADHIRACAFAVHENVYPGNKEEKYVIRRLLRRAVLDGRQMGHNGAFLHLLVPKVAEMMQVPYPDLSETTQRVAKVIETEEEHFIGTVDSGLEKIEKIFTTISKSGGRKPAGTPADKPPTVPGAEIFDMYQTFGFPPELFETLASERGFGFDWAGFKREMEHHGEISGSAEKGALFKDDPLAEIKKTHKTEFVGYDELVLKGAKITAIVADGKLVDKWDKTDSSVPIQIVLDKTPFYGEKGGQVGDIGTLSLISTLPDGWYDLIEVFNVTTTQIDGDLVLHVGHLHKDSIKVGDEVFARIHAETRMAIARAHTATHLLHHALRLYLGGHAEQQGSKVADDELRFDFTHHQAVDRQTLQEIEVAVNKYILDSYRVGSVEATIEEARKAGAIMLFGEKYPERVRVVVIGGQYGKPPGARPRDWMGNISQELCGGTHIENTSEIGLFKIISEESIASGVRRITALTGEKAVAKVLADSALLQSIATTLKIPAEKIPEKIASLSEQLKQLQKKSKMGIDKQQTATVNVDELIAGAETVVGRANVGTLKLVTSVLPFADLNAARQVLDQIKQKSESTAVVLAYVQEGKVTLLTGLSRDLVAKGLDAVKWIDTLVPLIGGKKGGGRADFGQSGGNNAAKLPVVFDEAGKFFC